MTDAPNHQPRNQVLHAMAINGWAMDSGGSQDSPEGLFYRMTNTQPELHEITQAFTDEIREAGLRRTRDLLGHFIVTDRLDGYTVDEYITRSLMMSSFAGRIAAHDAWGMGR